MSREVLDNLLCFEICIDPEDFYLEIGNKLGRQKREC